MRVDAAMVCDAASVREGLLFVLGGGVTRVWRPEYPAPLNVSVALIVTLHPTEADHPHAIRLALQTEDGQTVAEAQGQFGVQPEVLTQLQPGEEVAIPIALPFNGVALAAEGSYSFELLIDGNHQQSLPFRAAGSPG
jgi:hypothetical protein